MNEAFTFLDTPGSIEFAQETADALNGADAAVVVCEADPAKAPALVPLFKMLDELDLPRFVFVNKVDRASGSITELFDALQVNSAKPLVLRQIPLMNGGEHPIGYIDLAQERGYIYQPGKESQRVDIPAGEAGHEKAERSKMLEKLADFDDKLMEQLLEDVTPPKDSVMAQLSKDLAEDLIAPVFLGAADRMGGVHRLLKALRHEAPTSARAAKAKGVDELGEPLAQVLKTYHTTRGGKLSVARVWRGMLKDGMTLNGERVSGLFRLLGQTTEKLDQAGPGEVVGLGRMEKALTGDTLSLGKDAKPLPKPDVHQPVYALAMAAADRNDEVKISSAMHKLLEEDRSLRFFHDDETHEWILAGAGEMHLRVSADRLKSKFGLSVNTSRPHVPYKEAIRKPVTQPARFKRQSGGHGQFGDVTLEIKPLPRGSGFKFENGIVGGVVPKNFIPAVEEGVSEYLKRGPLGFPMVDIAVKLIDGKYHDVDSSEMSFKTVGRMAMQEGTPKCDPVLLEPIVQVEIAVPSAYTSKVNALVSGRRGQILGFDARPGWSGWDVVTAHLPQVETRDLIIELRSLTAGVGTFTSRFDHLQELIGRLADEVIAARAADHKEHAKA
jgi:elongation factor G